MKPIQQHILFCMGSDCKKNGNKKAYKVMKKTLKNKKQNFARCSQTKCLGACRHAPIMAVYPHGVWYKDVTSQKQIEHVIDEHLVNGKPVQSHILHQMKVTKSNS